MTQFTDLDAQAYAYAQSYSYGQAPPKLPPSFHQAFYPAPAQPSYFYAPQATYQTVPQPAFAPARPVVTVDKEKVYEGVVKTYNLASGFGFIRQEELYARFDRDVFFNRAIEGAEKIESGLQVMFKIHLNEKGQPQAVDLKLSLAARSLQNRRSKAPPPDKTFYGVIRTFNQNLGYGFINCSALKDEYDRDVFCHKQQFEGLEVGDQVQFKVTVNSRGQPQAREVMRNDINPDSETLVDPPEGKTKFSGRLRPFQHDTDYSFLDSDEAARRFDSADVYVHRSHCPEGDLEGAFKFDIVLVKSRPQARNLVRLSSKDIIDAEDQTPIASTKNAESASKTSSVGASPAAGSGKAASSTSGGLTSGVALASAGGTGTGSAGSAARSSTTATQNKISSPSPGATTSASSPALADVVGPGEGDSGSATKVTTTKGEIDVPGAVLSSSTTTTESIDKNSSKEDVSATEVVTIGGENDSFSPVKVDL